MNKNAKVLNRLQNKIITWFPANLYKQFLYYENKKKEHAFGNIKIKPQNFIIKR